MNEQFQNKIIELIEAVQTTAAEQIPDVAQQMIKWGVYGNLIEAALWTVSLLLICFFAFKIANYINKSDDWGEDERVMTYSFAFTVFCGILVILVPAICYNLYTAAYAYIAPKAYLITELKEMIR
jgi:hypothetical protein